MTTSHHLRLGVNIDHVATIRNARGGIHPCPLRAAEVAAAAGADGEKQNEKIHMDLESDTGHLPARTVAFRGIIFYGWLLAFMGSMVT